MFGDGLHLHLIADLIRVTTTCFPLAYVEYIILEHNLPKMAENRMAGRSGFSVLYSLAAKVS